MITNNQQCGNDARENLTDLGNSRRLVRLYGKDLRYCHPWRRWLCWNGKQWASDPARAYQLAVQAIAAMYAEAAELSDTLARQELVDHARGSESSRAIDAMLKLATFHPEIVIDPSELDTKPMLLNVENGTIDLATGELQQHNREDYLTQIVPLSFDREATCPRWEQFLSEVFAGDILLVGFMQRLVGYCLTGSTCEQILPILYGLGSNGKSVLISTLLAMFGKDFAMQARSELLMVGKNEHPTLTADLYSKRFCAASETESGGRLNEALIKGLTGSDDIRTRRLYENHFQFTPTHKVWLSTNHKPEIRGTDDAIWRRPLLIPFAVKFEGDSKDKHLADKLRNELTGILSWSVRGCLEWQRMGLAPPETVLNATQAYRSEQDILAVFLEECCEQGPDLKVRASDIYRRYKRWAEHNGETPETQHKFGKRLAERGFTRVISNGVTYRGIAINV